MSMQQLKAPILKGVPTPTRGMIAIYLTVGKLPLIGGLLDIAKVDSAIEGVATAYGVADCQSASPVVHASIRQRTVNLLTAQALVEAAPADISKALENVLWLALRHYTHGARLRTALDRILGEHGYAVVSAALADDNKFGAIIDTAPREVLSNLDTAEIGQVLYYLDGELMPAANN